MNPLRSGRARLVLPALSCLVAVLGGCVAGELASNDPDAGPDADQCTIEISLLSAPDLYEAPATVELEATVRGNGDLLGAQEVTWSVSGPGGPVAVETIESFAIRARFIAQTPGGYVISAQGRAGDLVCVGGQRPLDVRAPGATPTLFQLRIIPAPGRSAVSRQEVVEIWSGAAHDLGVFDLPEGRVFDARVVDSSGAGVAAYVRATPLSGGPARETHSDVTGDFSMRFDDGDVRDVLVVPGANAGAPGSAPVTLFRSHVFSLQSSQDFVLPIGNLFSATVTDGAGQPLSGASIALQTPDLPATLASTGADGLFSARLAAAITSTLLVRAAPPVGLPLPTLEVPASAGLVVDPQQPMATIAFADSITTRTVAPRIVARDGATPLPGARVTWISRPIADAGVVTVPGDPSVNVPGTARHTVIADATGQLPSLELPRGIYDVVIDPPPGSAEDATLLVVDITGAGPTLLATTALARLTGRVVDSQGAGVANARIAATARGVLASSLGATRVITTASDGSFDLALPGDGDYDITVTGPASEHAVHRLQATAPSAGQNSLLGDIALARALAYTGRVMLGGANPGGAAGATVHLLCITCPARDRELPVAEAVTDRFGYFVLPAPDPGVTANGTE